jgi:hypothetical protein
MSNSVRNPDQPWRWSMHGRRNRWHVLLPADGGIYKRALCGFIPPDGWEVLLSSPPMAGGRPCVTCYTRAYRQGVPLR